MRVPLAALAVFLVVLAGCSAGVGTTESATVTADSSLPGTDTAAPNGTVTVHFINAGQSSSTLVVGPTGETVLVDTGAWQDDGEYVLSYLQRLGVERIDYLVTSHADADHIGGHAAVIEYYETRAEGVGAVYDPGIAASSRTYEQYLDAVETYDVPLYRTQAGDEIPLEGVEARVLSPPADPLASGDRNENSIVLDLAFGRTRVLLPGDAGPAAERYLVETYGSRLDATVLQASHHGSRTGTSTALLAATTPGAVVVSSAYDSPYGHPHRELLHRLANRSIPTYWTAVHGTVVVETTGTNVTIAAQQNATTKPLSLRAAPSVSPGTTASLDPVTRLEPGETPTAPEAGSRLTVATIHADAAGNDHDNLADEYVVFRNEGPDPLALSGWTVRDAAGHAYEIPDGVVLSPGANLTLRTGAPPGTTPTTTDDGDVTLYWGADQAVWNNDGDTISVTTDDGVVAVEVSY